MTPRKRTSTSNFGAGARENHDATAFYQRFRAPEISDDSYVPPPKPVDDPFICGDSCHMDEIEDGTVALVVTSPPYFAGKTYEEELEREGVPGSYLEYLEMLTSVFRECVRKLEPGGRIAVNVANLGRKPYRSLSADVIRILEHDLGLLLRGEIIWQKGEGANGSCAWGSFRSASNPVLRDITERVIVASKGRFDRARTVKQRTAEGLPHESSATQTTEDFMGDTLDVWNIPPESARRVGHPAPFPVELPDRIIRLYTFADDLILDPFMGSGSSLVAAAQLGRRYIGYDLDPTFVAIARHRVALECDVVEVPETTAAAPLEGLRPAIAVPAEVTEPAEENFQRRATREGKAAQRLAEDVLEAAGFTIAQRNQRIPKTGVTVNYVAEDDLGNQWFFDVSGAFTTHRGGLLRTDTVWKALGKASALRGRAQASRFILLTSNLPKRPSEGDTALRAAGPHAFFDAIEMLSDEGRTRLERYASGALAEPLGGFWTDADLDRRAADA